MIAKFYREIVSLQIQMEFVLNVLMDIIWINQNNVSNSFKIVYQQIHKDNALNALINIS